MVHAQQEAIAALEEEVEELSGLEDTVAEVDQAMTDMATCMASYVSGGDDDDEEPERERTDAPEETTMAETTVMETTRMTTMMTTASPTKTPTASPTATPSEM